MTTPSELHQRLRALSGDQLSVAPGQLQPTSHLHDDLGVDSLAAIEWGMSIEDAFGISLPEDSWERLTTYGMVEDLVTRLVATSSSAQA